MQEVIWDSGILCNRRPVCPQDIGNVDIDKAMQRIKTTTNGRDSKNAFQNLGVDQPAGAGGSQSINEGKCDTERKLKYSLIRIWAETAVKMFQVCGSWKMTHPATS